MRLLVDALGKTADDTKSGVAEMAGKLERVPAARARRIATADNGQCRQVQELRVAIDIQNGWRARNSGEQLGVGVVTQPNPMMIRVL